MQLDRMLRSKTFVQSEKLCRFLRFVVEHVLHGNQSCLKEYLVGVEVYDRKPPYDPSQDSIVRTEARRLRNKLKEYYGEEGKEDPVYIYLRPGSYVPVFQCREDLIGIALPPLPATPFACGSCPIPTAVLAFRDISQNATSAMFARGIPDELAYALMLDSACAVISPTSIERLAVDGDVTTTMSKVGAQIAFEGSARAEGSSLRVTARIIDVAGTQLWLRRMDVEIGSQSLFSVEEDIARELCLGLQVVREASLGALNPHG